MSGKMKLDPSEIFTMAKKTMRSHKYKIQKTKVNSTRKTNAFSNRIVHDWNILPSMIVTSKTTNEFKNSLDEHWRDEMFQTPF